MEINLHKKSAYAFCRAFDSLQMCCYYILYYDFDWDLEKIKEFNQCLHTMNDTVTSKDVALIVKVSKTKGIDFERMALNFPWRIKQHMYGKKIKCGEMDMVRQNLTEAVELIMIFVSEVLGVQYKFEPKQVLDFWNHVEEFARLYTNKEPLRDDHILKYFKQECNLDIAM